ncbi:RagB/SusD family nutrient uptake outer membrane protein [Bacteroides clarus]|uniref:RagB/SusD family nutrient uptake outer membrane protein n=1 Tax=Bacteroides clarus TaxID=626929 RepID=A0A412Y018_9BACE|nr:RagB/SusD family nutrient uptake outer membrane protein [Bacteroides clarus]RGV33650.1 RagB/SusD family nutrient uptake outer membrane protein [Bacteroides clarus]RGV50873.1 RagB/SusD family nutrient uptake outer membrane protein [Bacteroides clarus]
MLNIKKYMIMACALLSLNGCDYLDYDHTTGKTKEEAYAYYENMNQLVAYVYTFLPSDLGSGYIMESATDNCIYTQENASIYYMTTGVWSPLKRVDDAWNYWTAIRSANSFLENFDPEVLKRFEYNENYDEIMEKSSKFPYEVRFLRAFYLFELAKRYGDIPLLTRTYAQDEINSVKQTPFDEVIAFIAEECSEIAPELPVNQSDFWGETGRITRGAALALKSRALLYAASELHNPDNDLTKWENAAKAAYEVMDLAVYELPKITDDPLYSNKGGNEIFKSKQLILERRNSSKTNNFEARNQPMGYPETSALGGNTPTQNLVDAFEMKDGTPFDWGNASHVANIYYDTTGKQTRDPRLYLNVLTNGSTWLSEQVETFEGGKNKIQEGSTRTGYYLRKWMNPSVSLDPVKPNKIEHHYILFRYAEILLNYAEAMNEWLGPDAVDAAKGCPVSARAALNQVRTAATMDGVVATGQVDFREKVRNERRVELALEGHRFYDIRRWKIAEKDEVRNIYGVKIAKSGEDSFSYEKELLQTMYWENKMYLFPYPQNELYMNDNLVQNPGW